LRKIVKTAVSVLFLAMVSVVFAGVIARYVLNNSIIWAEEFSRYTCNWVIMLACAQAVGSNSHLAVDLIYRVIPNKFVKAYQAIVDICILAFFLFMVFQSFKLVTSVGSQISAAMRISMRYVYFGMPVGFTLMFIFGVERLIKDLRGMHTAEKGEMNQ